MYVLSYFLESLANILNIVLGAYIWIIIGRAIISWVNPDPYNPIVRFLYEVTEPVLSRVRRYIPVFPGGLDLTPMILIIAIIFVQGFIVKTLLKMAQSFGY